MTLALESLWPKHTDAEAVEVSTAAADVGILGLVPKLGNAADDDGIEAKDLANLGCRCRIGAVSCWKSFARPGFCRVPSDSICRYASRSMHQILHPKVGDAPARTSISVPNKAAGLVFTVA